MKAVVIREFGNADVLKVEEVVTPKPREGHILIKVLAAGINRLDYYLREGSVVPDLPFPHILGIDAAGEVAELGPGTNGFRIGERVIPTPGFPLRQEEYDISPVALAPSFTLLGLGRPGTYAQYLEIPAKWVIKDSTGLGPEEVATLPVVLGSSTRAVKNVGQVKRGDKVLVHAGASGSGSMQIQVAKILEADVATTVRDDAKGEFARKAGADFVINTRRESFVDRIKEWTDGVGADVVIDNLGGDVLRKSIEVVKPLGLVVAYGFAAGPTVSFDIRSLFFQQKKIHGTMASDLDDLAWGLEQVRAGRIKPLLDKALPLTHAGDAHRLIAANEVSGNLVLLPWSE